jgi:hypothetical protein
MFELEQQLLKLAQQQGSSCNNLQAWNATTKLVPWNAKIKQSLELGKMDSTILNDKKKD